MADVSEKRMYHVAHVNLDGVKTWTKARPLADAKEFAEELAATTPLKAQAKSHYEWIAENGIVFGVEREEHADNAELVSISVFERDDPALDPKPLPTPEQVLRSQLARYRDFAVKVRDFEFSDISMSEETADFQRAARKLIAQEAGGGDDGK